MQIQYIKIRHANPSMLFHLSLSGSRGLEFVPATIGREAGVLCGQICSQGRETSTHIHTCGRFRITRWPPLTLSWWQQIVGGCLVVGASLYQYRGLYLSILKALGQLIVIWCCINNIERKSNEYTLHDKPHDYNIHTDTTQSATWVVTETGRSVRLEGAVLTAEEL